MGSRMQCVAFFLALTIAVEVSGHFNCTNCGSSKCNEFEVPVAKRPRRDRFCRPLVTPTWETRRLRHCVCKRGYVRNSWGDCIPLPMCRRCKCRLQKDWNLCATACPAACDMTISASCSKTCVPGCDCPPGWVLDQDNWKKCIKAKRCSPVCPLHSHFEPCVNSCAPKCGVSPPKECKTTCYRGDCVCDKGFAEFVQYGRKICVRHEQCAWYLQTKSPFTLVGTEFTNGGASQGGIANRGQGTVQPPGTITVIHGGPLVRGPSGNLITINGSTGVGTISNSAPRPGGIGAVSGLPRVSTEIGVIQGRPGLPTPVSSGNAGILSTGSATHPVGTWPIGGSAVSATRSLPFLSTGNIGFGVDLRGTLQPAGTVTSTVGSGTGALSTVSTLSPGTLHIREGISGVAASVPEQYRRLTLGTSGVPSPVPLARLPGISAPKVSVSTLTVTQGGTLRASASSPSPGVVGGMGTNINSNGGMLATLGGASSSTVGINTISAQPTLTLQNFGLSAVSRNVSRLGGTGVTASPISTHIPTRGGALTPSTMNQGGNTFPASGTHFPAGIKPDTMAAPVFITPEIGPSGATRAPSTVPSTGIVSGAGINVQNGASPPNLEHSGGHSLGSHTAGVRETGTTITAGTNGLQPGASYPPVNVAHQGGGVGFTSTSTGNVPGHINVGTGTSTALISVQGSSVRGMPGAREPLRGAASRGISGVTSAVPYLPGTAGYNNLLLRSHLRSARSFSSIISGNSILKKFPEFQKLYPEGVDLGEIQPEFKRQVEVLLKRGTLRDES